MDLLLYRQELDLYYRPLRQSVLEQNEAFVQLRENIYQEMDQNTLRHPHLSGAALKAELHARMAEGFEPVIFVASQ